MSARKGITLSLLSSILFSVLCYYSVFLYPLNGWQIAGWRAVTTALLLILALAFRKKMKPFWRYFLSVVKSARLLAAMCVCAALLALQIIIFCWAPVNGQSRSLALGYFLLPLVMVITGRALYGEMMSGWQKIAVLLAACGVTAEVFMVRSLPLVALVVMLGYPPYFIIKRQLKSDAFFSVIAENLFLVIPAVVLLIYQGSGNEWLPTGGWRTVTGLGLLSCSALLCFLLTSSSLSFTLFGMLSYVEPLLLFLVSLFLPGEKLSLSSLLTYVPIWLAVLALMADGYKKVKSTTLSQSANCR
ncbi:EamA family transporter RarD [Erwinia sp. ACCC 02193]|jgi:chloramphenicol-sensitive protein RarD|uniref:EamA family transporter RarD n=1 Tax=Erwinia aeris TaxID=3239803 RepID=A0ABV4ECR1_9GAMM